MRGCHSVTSPELCGLLLSLHRVRLARARLAVCEDCACDVQTERLFPSLLRCPLLFARSEPRVWQQIQSIQCGGGRVGASALCRVTTVKCGRGAGGEREHRCTPQCRTRRWGGPSARTPRSVWSCGGGGVGRGRHGWGRAGPRRDREARPLCRFSAGFGALSGCLE